MTTVGLVIVSLFYVGILLLAIGFVQNKAECPAPKTIYKFVPRTFEESQEDPALPSEIFKDMFSGSGSIKSLLVTDFEQPVANDIELNRANIQQ